MPKRTRSSQGATIREVAAAAEVSIATVSRALSNPDLVAPHTRDRVLGVTRELGYRSRSTARPQSPVTLGLVVPDIENPFFGQVAKGVQARARAAGCLVVVCDVEEDPVIERAVLEQVADGVDGLILCSPRGTDGDVRRSVGDLPTVVANRRIDGFPAVLADEAHGMRSVMRHLVALGHRRIAYAGGPQISWSNGRRSEAVHTISAEEAVEVVDLGSFAPYLRGGLGAADQAIAADVTAVVCFNDLLALGVLDRLIQRGVRVPEEMSVSGIDNVDASTYVRPQLTTVDSARLRMGRTSVDLLLDILRGDEPASPQLLPTELIVRDSTGPVPEAVRESALSAS